MEATREIKEWYMLYFQTPDVSTPKSFAKNANSVERKIGRPIQLTRARITVTILMHRFSLRLYQAGP